MDGRYGRNRNGGRLPKTNCDRGEAKRLAITAASRPRQPVKQLPADMVNATELTRGSGDWRHTYGRRRRPRRTARPV